MRYDVGRFRRPMRRSTEGQMMSLISLGDGSTLTLDFTTGQLDPRLTFTRAANTATVINSSGLVQTVNADVPRFDYDPTTLAPKGLLIEGSATNVLKNSNALTSSGWSQIGIASTTQSVSIDAPSGLKEAWIVEESTASGYHVRRFSATTTAAAWTFSFWAKAKEHDRVCLGDQSNGRVCATFVLTGNGTAAVVAGAGSPTNPTIVRHQNGWYRCSVTATMTAATSGIGVGGYPTSGTAFDGFGVTFTGTSGNGVYLYGFQAELGSGASSYIPTTTSSATRNADECSMTGSNFSDWFNASEGTFLARFCPLVQTAGGLANTIVSANDNTANEQIALASITNGRLVVIDGGSTLANVTSGTVTLGSVARLAGAYKLNDCQSCTGGVLGTADTSVTLPTVDRLFIGRSGGASPTFLLGHIESLKFYPTRLPDATLQSLTT